MQFPPLERWQRYPVTVGIGLGAAMMTAWWWSGANIDRWTMDDRFWSGNVWQPLTCCLLHVNVFHLAFNLYWLWIFGVFLEEFYGSARYAAIVFYLAVGSSLAEYALSNGGVGLSGVGYGLFGMLWALRRLDRRFYHAIDDSTVKVFIGWFFLCIVTTMAEVMAIGNVAHGSGAIFGALLGYAIGEKDRYRKIGYASLILLSMSAIFAAASVGREYVNFSGEVRRWERQKRANLLAKEGIQAFVGRDYGKAAGLFSEAVAIDDAEAGYWYNLGLCRRYLRQQEQALDAFRHAVELEPDNPKYKIALEMQPPSD